MIVCLRGYFIYVLIIVINLFTCYNKQSFSFLKSIPLSEESDIFVWLVAACVEKESVKWRPLCDV